MDKKLNAKDLINIGLFSVFYIVICFIAAMVGIVPVLIPIVPAVAALLGGIPFVLLLTKIKKFGMVSIMAILISLIFYITGYGWVILITYILCGLIAVVILNSGEYRSWKKSIIAYSVFTLGYIGVFYRFGL